MEPFLHTFAVFPYLQHNLLNPIPVGWASNWYHIRIGLIKARMTRFLSNYTKIKLMVLCFHLTLECYKNVKISPLYNAIFLCMMQKACQSHIKLFKGCTHHQSIGLIAFKIILLPVWPPILSGHHYGWRSHFSSIPGSLMLAMSIEVQQVRIIKHFKGQWNILSGSCSVFTWSFLSW